MNEVIVIGKGPAGISASLYIKRGGIDVTIIANGHGSLEKADKVQNYFGTAPIVSGAELLQNGIKQAEALGIEIKNEEVVNIQWLDNFVVTTTKGKYEAKCLVLATGSARRSPKIVGLDKLVGHGVSYCAMCDAFFYRGKKVAIIGEGNYAQHEAEALLKCSERYILTNGKKAVGDFDGMKVVETKIKQIVGNEKVEQVLLEDGSKIDVDGVFVALGQANSSSFAKELGIFIEDNHLVVDKNMATSVPGIFCAGDCIGGLLQISKAVADGAIAGTSVVNFFKE